MLRTDNGKKSFLLEDFSYERGKLNLKIEFHVSFHNLMFQFKIKRQKEKLKAEKLSVSHFLMLI